MIDNWDWPEDESSCRRISLCLNLYLIEYYKWDFSRYEPEPRFPILQAIAKQEYPWNLIDFAPRMNRTETSDSANEKDKSMLMLLQFLLSKSELPKYIDSHNDALKQICMNLRIEQKEMSKVISDFLRPILGEPLW